MTPNKYQPIQNIEIKFTYNQVGGGQCMWVTSRLWMLKTPDLNEWRRSNEEVIEKGSRRTSEPEVIKDRYLDLYTT